MDTSNQYTILCCSLGLLSGGVVFMVRFYWLIVELWWNPIRIRRIFEDQGVRGPPYRFLVGNAPEIEALVKEERVKIMDRLSNDIGPRIFPHHKKWSELYGKPFLYWFGSKPRLIVSEPELIKEILANKFGHYSRSRERPDIGDLVGNSLVLLEGKKWAEHRRIVSPAFNVNHLQLMTSTMATSVAEMLDNWRKVLASGQNEIDVSKEFRVLTADVIARAGFGSSYREGKSVFEMQTEQIVIMAEVFRSAYIPGYKYIPTAQNRRRWKLQQEVERSLTQIIENRRQAGDGEENVNYGNDLLGLMLSAARQEESKGMKLTLHEIVDECKTFFFAGHETTSTLLTWTLFLLSQHQEWQERARAEVLDVCGKHPPNAEMANHLNIVGMVLNETLRLYPPVVGLGRENRKTMKLGKLVIPPGTQLFLPILDVHHDQTIWGDDAKDFNPQRFADVVGRASELPMAFMPFGMGPRICVGQNFALLEAKLALAMILQSFSFHLSPSYRHSPATVITIQPEYGMQIVLLPNGEESHVSASAHD